MLLIPTDEIVDSVPLLGITGLALGYAPTKETGGPCYLHHRGVSDDEIGATVDLVDISATVGRRYSPAQFCGPDCG